MYVKNVSKNTMKMMGVMAMYEVDGVMTVWCNCCYKDIPESDAALAWFSPKSVNCTVFYKCKKCYEDEK